MTASPDSGEARSTLICGMRPVHTAVLGVALLTLFRFWYSCRFDLISDEAYYWVWSKHFALSYRDKGPLVAWTIALGTKLFGDTVFGVRFFAVLLSAGTALQLFRLAQRLYDDRTALWCLGVAAIIPLFGIGSILMTIDPLSVFFWAWGANLAWLSFTTGQIRYWLLLGAAIGMGFLAKFVNAIQLVSIVMFLCWSRPHRHFLFSRQSLAMLLGFAVCSLPVFWWNVQTGWLHIQALNERGGLNHSLAIHPSEVLHHLIGQVGAITPLLLIGMVIATIGLWRIQSDQPRVKHLLSQFIPIQALYLLLSLNSRIQPNWIAPSLIAGIVLLVAFWRQFILQHPKWRWAAWVSLGMALVATLAIHAAVFFPIPLKYDVFHKAEGWVDFAEHVQQARQQNRADLLIANYYTQGSMMQFYLPDHPLTYLPPARYGNSQFTLWPGYQVARETRALYVVDTKPKLSPNVEGQFNHSQLVDDFWSKFHGRPIGHFFIFLLWND
ncbi:MAG TPA: glycosyltransferase family 39 protein [Verrucomicrobiae bacterium]|nr:glycosyltransferase family 39 protein [Verrucomicrobiae bacterium]